VLAGDRWIMKVVMVVGGGCWWWLVVVVHGGCWPVSPQTPEQLAPREVVQDPLRIKGPIILARSKPIICPKVVTPMSTTEINLVKL